MNETTENAALADVPSTSWLGWIDANDRKPSTGRKVLVSGHLENGNRWRTIATWQPAGTLDASMWDDPPEEWWDESGDICTNPTDEWCEEPIEGERSYELSRVTHWMPLPDLPLSDNPAPMAEIEARIKAHAQPDQPTVCELALCEATRLVLKPDQLYRFTVHKGCAACHDAALVDTDGRKPPF